MLTKTQGNRGAICLNVSVVRFLRRSEVAIITTIKWTVFANTKNIARKFPLDISSSESKPKASKATKHKYSDKTANATNNKALYSAEIFVVSYSTAAIPTTKMVLRSVRDDGLIGNKVTAVCNRKYVAMTKKKKYDFRLRVPNHPLKKM